MTILNPQFKQTIRLFCISSLCGALFSLFLTPKTTHSDNSNQPRRTTNASDAWFNEVAKYGAPEGTWIRKGKFLLAFDGRTRCPRWVLEKLTPEILAGNADRRKKFSDDGSIPVEFRPIPLDYVEPVYDQGHLAAANNYGDQLDCDATFTLSNCMPQMPELNQRTWRFLEAYVRSIVREPGVEAVWCLTIPIWWEPDESKNTLWIELIGNSRIHVPTHCGKAILVKRKDGIELKAWIIPNTADIKAGTSELVKFLVSVDKFEKISGLDAWPLLENGSELEAAVP